MKNNGDGRIDMTAMFKGVMQHLIDSTVSAYLPAVYGRVVSVLASPHFRDFTSTKRYTHAHEMQFNAGPD